METKVDTRHLKRTMISFKSDSGNFKRAEIPGASVQGVMTLEHEVNCFSRSTELQLVGGKKL